MKNVSDTNLQTSKQSAGLDATMDTVPRILSNRSSLAKLLRDED